LIAVTDEGEIARSVASYLDEEVIVATSSDVVLRERPRAVIHTFEVGGGGRPMSSCSQAPSSLAIPSLEGHEGVPLIFDARELGFFISGAEAG
jgi:hypothetical protein